MAVSAIETLTGFVPTLTTPTPVITTSLVPTDRVLILIPKDGTTGTPTVSGLGATWTTHINEATTRDFFVFSAAGITGGGTLTLNGYSAAGDYIIFVLRSSLGVTPQWLGFLSPTWMVGTVAPGVVKTSGALPVPAGSFVVGVGNATAGVSTAPTTSSQPAAGSWTAVYTNGGGGLKVAKYVPTVDESVEMSVSASGSGNLGAVVMAVNDAAFTGTPPSSIIERQPAITLTGGGTANVTLTTNLLPSDVVVVLFYGIFTATSPTVTAPGMSFTQAFGTTTKRLNSWIHWGYYGSGGVGTGKIVTIASYGGTGARAQVYVLRGLNSAVLSQITSSTYGSTLSTGKSVSAPSDVGVDQIAILSLLEEASVPFTFPASPVPASGWHSVETADDLNTTTHEDIASSGPMSGGVTVTSTGGYVGVTLMVFGTPTAAPPATGFTGWGSGV